MPWLTSLGLIAERVLLVLPHQSTAASFSKELHCPFLLLAPQPQSATAVFFYALFARLRFVLLDQQS
jgi:hypothetical protein